MSGLRVTLEGFIAYDGDKSVHYERDHDLTVHTREASGGGEVAGLLLIELGIDGSEVHTVRLDLGAVAPGEDVFRYVPGDELHILRDAIKALTTIADEMERMTLPVGNA